VDEEPPYSRAHGQVQMSWLSPMLDRVAFEGAFLVAIEGAHSLIGLD